CGWVFLCPAQDAGQPELVKPATKSRKESVWHSDPGASWRPRGPPRRRSTACGSKPDERDPAPSQRRPTKVGREGAKQLVVGRESGDLTSTADENRGPECLGASLLL